jgi:hypothetical protein
MLALDLLILLAFAALLGSAAALALRATGRLEEQRVARRLQCPVMDRAAQCVLVRDVRTGRWIGVERCSLLPDPDAPSCDKACLRLLELRATLKPREEARTRG